VALLDPTYRYRRCRDQGCVITSVVLVKILNLARKSFKFKNLQTVKNLITLLKQRLKTLLTVALKLMNNSWFYKSDG